MFIDLLDMYKAKSHKYTHKRRVYIKGKPAWRYFYKEHHGGGVTNVKDIKEGEAFKVKYKGKEGHFKVLNVEGDKVTVVHDETGKETTLSKSELRQVLLKTHATALKENVEKKKQTLAKRKSAKAKERAQQALDRAKSKIDGLEDEPQKKKQKTNVESVLREVNEEFELKKPELEKQSADRAKKKQEQQKKKKLEQQKKQEEQKKRKRDLQQKIIDMGKKKKEVKKDVHGKLARIERGLVNHERSYSETELQQTREQFLKIKNDVYDRIHKEFSAREREKITVNDSILERDHKNDKNKRFFDAPELQTYEPDKVVDWLSYRYKTAGKVHADRVRIMEELKALYKPRIEQLIENYTTPSEDSLKRLEKIVDKAKNETNRGIRNYKETIEPLIIQEAENLTGKDKDLFLQEAKKQVEERDGKYNTVHAHHKELQHMVVDNLDDLINGWQKTKGEAFKAITRRNSTLQHQVIAEFEGGYNRIEIANLLYYVVEEIKKEIKDQPIPPPDFSTVFKMSYEERQELKRKYYEELHG